MKVRNAGTEQDLGIQYKALKPEVDKLNIMAAKRQQVISIWQQRSDCGSKGVWWIELGWEVIKYLNRYLSSCCS